jgi:hypothetical protein
MSEPSDQSVHGLRRRWKPTKQRLQAVKESHPTSIRFHRACSWLQRVEEFDGSDHDLTLICQWIAYNALYGQWDDQKREPRPDRECWRRFCDRILDLDQDGRVGAVLIDHKKLVMSLLDDEYLSRYFWEEPSAKRAGQSKKAKYDARTWYLEKRWAMVLERMMERIYMMRCQLVHGAASHGGGLNRTSLRRSSTMLGHLLPAMLRVWIDHGSDEDWGPMCYPPMGG